MKFFSSLRWRLTLSFLAIFAFLLSVLLIGFYFWIKSEVYRATDSSIKHELGEARAAYQRNGVNTLTLHIQMETRKFGADRVFYQLLDKGSNLIFSTDLSTWGQPHLDNETIQNLKPGKFQAETLKLDKNQKFIRLVSLGLRDGYVVQSGVYIKKELKYLARYKKILFAVGCLVLLLASFSSFWILGVLVAGINKVSLLASHIPAKNLQERLVIESRRDEISNLKIQFNKMLDRIEGLVGEVRQVSNDIAHDLKSPLTRIRLSTEKALRSSDLSHDNRTILDSSVKECDKLIELINSILDISSINAGALALEGDEVDLSQVVSQAIELMSPIAELKEIKIISKLQELSYVKATLQQMQRVVSNIIDNAIKYTHQGGEIRLSISKESGQIVFRCQDNGIGISTNDCSRVFDKFYRCDATRGAEGHGLGLTLCSSIVKAYGGRLEVKSILGEGTTFSVFLPTC